MVVCVCDRIYSYINICLCVSVYMYDFIYIYIIKGKKSSIWGSAWEGCQVGKYLAQDEREEREEDSNVILLQLKHSWKKKKTRGKKEIRKGRREERRDEGSTQNGNFVHSGMN